MNYDKPKRRSRRLIKAGIAAFVAVGATSAVFASQAEAARVKTTNVMLNIPADVGCVSIRESHYVFPFGEQVRIGNFDTAMNDWKPGWNSIGVHTLKRKVTVSLSRNNCQPPFSGIGPSSQTRTFKVTKPTGPWPDDFFDDSNGPINP